MGCLLRQWDFALVNREIYAKPDFPRLLLDGDSLHLHMPGCRHAGMVFPPSAKLHPETERHDSRHIGMRIQKIRVNRYTNEITIDGTTRPSRRQVATLLDYLLKAPTHEISFTELNTVFNENFFDGSPASKRKISNLKYEINDLLKNLGFELVKTSSDQFALTAKRKEVI